MSTYEVWSEGAFSRIHLPTCAERAGETGRMRLFRSGYGILIEAWVDAARNGQGTIAACKVCIADAKNDAARWDAAIMSMPSECEFSAAKMVQQSAGLGFGTTRGGQHNHCKNREERGYLMRTPKGWVRTVIANAGDLIQEELDSVSEAENFDPSSVDDDRKRILCAIAQRRGQPAFRKALIQRYRGACAVTGCNAVAALEAAHIIPYQGSASNHPGNGLLLRADIHTLFDLHLFSIDPETMTVCLDKRLHGTGYEELEGATITQPAGEVSIREALRARTAILAGISGTALD